MNRFIYVFNKTPTALRQSDNRKTETAKPQNLKAVTSHRTAQFLPDPVKYTVNRPNGYTHALGYVVISAAAEP